MKLNTNLEHDLPKTIDHDGRTYKVIGKLEDAPKPLPAQIQHTNGTTYSVLGVLKDDTLLFSDKGQFVIAHLLYEKGGRYEWEQGHYYGNDQAAAERDFEARFVMHTLQDIGVGEDDVDAEIAYRVGATYREKQRLDSRMEKFTIEQLLEAMRYYRR